MTRPVTMDSNARVRRRSRKRYESCDHNFDTLIQNKYETRKTALDQNYASILRETRDHQRRKGESSNAKRGVHSGACPSETQSSESNKVKKQSGYRRGSLGSALSSSRKSHLEDDHNFDRLSQSFGSGSKMMELGDLEDSKPVEKCDKNNYWKQYEEKYGKLGITVTDNEGYSTKTKSLENVTSGSKSNSPRENILNSLSYSCNGVIGRHSFSKTDPDEAITDKYGEESVHNSELRVKESGNSQENPKYSGYRVRTSFGAKDSDDEKSLENLSSKPPKGQTGRRRAASDLGFTDSNCQTPRTSALLRQPSFRKHLAKVMHVKDKQGEVQDSLTLELAFRVASTTNLLKLKNSSEEEVDKLGQDWSLDTDSKLRISTSEYNLRCKSAETSPRNSEIFDWENYKIIESNDLEEEPILMKSLSLPQSKQSSDLENKAEGDGHSKRSKFHIPSFNEFRKLRSESGLLPDKLSVHKRERRITEESEQDIEQKCDLERSISFSQNVQEKQEKPRPLRRTNTDPSIVVPDQEKGPESAVSRDESAEEDHERSKHRKDRSRRRLGVIDSHHEVKGRSRGHTVPQVSATSKLPTNEKVQSSKHTRPKNNHDENDYIGESRINVLRKFSDSGKNEQSSSRELDCWKQSVFDSEKGSDSDNGSLIGEQRMKRKRRSLRKAKTNEQRVQLDGQIETPYTDVRILNSDNTKKKHTGSGNEVEDSGSHPGREPTGLPPMAPKKLRRRSDGKSPRRRHRSIPEDEEAVSSDYLSSSGNFTSSTSDVQIDIENDTEDALKVTANNDLTCVMRSTSDVSEMIHEIARKRDNKEKRSKPYKSDPFGSSGRRRNLREATLMKESDQKRRIKGGSSEEEVITFLHRAKKLGREGQSLDEYLSDDDDHCRAEVERVDSGVGSEIKENVKPNIEVKLRGSPACDECNQTIHEKSEVGSDGALMCEKCAALRLERKEAIYEIVDTEISYGKDLKIIKEEFYLPMKTAGLLNADQIATIFGNLLELITVNERFTDQLQDTLDIACEQGDEDYTTVRLGKVFLEASNMLLVFEQYCVKLTTATSLVEQLEKEKELLRIFLQVSQTDNSALRRMNLKSFLMVPVQRIMRYPLLLNRVYKSSPTDHIDKKPLKDAQTKIEDIIEHINSNTKESSMNNKLRRKMSGSRRYISVGDPNIEFTKMALELLEWNRNDIDTIHVGRMHYTQPTDYLWPKKGKSLKFIHVMGILVTLGKGIREEWSEGLLFPRNTGVKEAALILVKEKNGKYIPFREPILLERCVVSVESEFDEVFEVLDINKESHIFRGDDRRTTETWYQHLKLQTKNLGQWRRRRNALPNIMIQNLTAKA